MALTASQVTTNNSLEQFRQEFNNLQSDVRGLESGTVSFSTVATNLQIIFEGTTADDNETTLGVIDPTADRTINLPNASGTVFLQEDTSNAIITGKTTITSGNIVPANDELILSDADAGTLKRVTVNNLISSAGGLTAVSADSTPQLGGDLDVNGNDIVSVSNGNINLLPNGSGKPVVLKNSYPISSKSSAESERSNLNNTLISDVPTLLPAKKTFNAVAGFSSAIFLVM